MRFLNWKYNKKENTIYVEAERQAKFVLVKEKSISEILKFICTTEDLYKNNLSQFKNKLQPNHKL